MEHLELDRIVGTRSHAYTPPPSLHRRLRRSAPSGGTFLLDESGGVTLPAGGQAAPLIGPHVGRWEGRPANADRGKRWRKKPRIIFICRLGVFYSIQTQIISDCVGWIKAMFTFDTVTFKALFLERIGNFTCIPRLNER